MKISILIPSANGFECLNECINSIFDNVSQIDRVQVIVKLDFGDKTILRINELNYKDKIKILIYDKLRGYADIHTFLNDMIKLCTDSDWVQVLNDDALYLTKNWDTFLEGIDKNQFLILTHSLCDGRMGDCGNDFGDYYFPYISIKYYEIVGYISNAPCYDGFLLGIVRRFRSIKDISKSVPIKFYHKFEKEIGEYISKEYDIKDYDSKDFDIINKIKKYLNL